MPKKMPFLKKSYTTHHQNNSDIISISIDADRVKWITALKKDLPIWINAIDDKEKNGIAELLNIYAVPANFLIDPKIGFHYRKRPS